MPQSVQLDVEPSPVVDVAPGERHILTLTLANRGRIPYHYSLVVSGIPREWYSLEETVAVVSPGATSTILLALHPQVRTAFAAGHYPFRVQVTAQEDAEVQTSAVVFLTVGAVGELRLAIEPQQIEGRQGTFTVQVTNEMPWPATVLLVTWAESDALRLRLDPAGTLVVPAHGVQQVAMHVAPRSSALHHPVTIDVWGVQPGREQAPTPRLSAQARFVYAPRRTPGLLPTWAPRQPRWLILLPLLVLFLVGIGAVAAGSGKLASAPPPPTATIAPSTSLTRVPLVILNTATPTLRPSPAARRVAAMLRIVQFALQPGEHGRPYRLVWGTRGARRVQLNGRRVAVQGQHMLYAPIRTATYHLVARNAAHRLTAIVRIVVGPHGASGPHAYVLEPPRIGTFTLGHRHGTVVAMWRVRNALRVRLGGRPAPRAGTRRIAPGTPHLKLVASNAVGTVQRTIHILWPRRHVVPPTATSTPQPTATRRPRPTATDTAAPTITPTPRPTHTAAPTVAPRPRPTHTPTPVPTATAQPLTPPTPTATVTPSATPFPSATATAAPTATRIPRQVVTPRRHRRPATPTPRPTRTPRPTPTSTVAPSATPRPTATRRPTATQTPRSTPTQTPRPTATETPRPTATETPPPTDTPQPTATMTPLPTPTPTTIQITIGG